MPELTPWLEDTLIRAMIFAVILTLVVIVVYFLTRMFR